MQDIETRQAVWHSRRGMLELDLLLLPFAEQRFEFLSSKQKNDYMELLSCEDQDIFEWLMLRADPADSRLKEVIRLILETGQVSV